MALVKDPVCGMMIDPKTAAGSVTSGGQTYYFCSAACEIEWKAKMQHRDVPRGVG